MDQADMLHQMCHEVLTEGEVRAVVKNRGLPAKAAGSRPLLEGLFLSGTGVAEALHSLEPPEIALLHLLATRDQPVDVTFFRRLAPPSDDAWPYSTFTQSFQGVFARVKDRLVRRGVLLLALGPESAAKKMRMERWLFSLPAPFARHLPPLVESLPLTVAGESRGDAARDKLKAAARPGADREAGDDRVEVVNRELRWGGRPFRSESVRHWRQLRWQAETAPAQRPKQADPYTLPPAEAVGRILAGLGAGHWCDPAALAAPLEVFCGGPVDAARVCESGWRWGFLARQQAEGRTWYRPAPPAGDAAPEQYLAVWGDAVSVDLDAVPWDALETLVQISDQHSPPGGQPLLVLTPNLVKLGRTADTAALPLAEWLRNNSPAFRQALETVRQRRGKTILHENLAVARVGDLALRVALEKALGSRAVVLGEEFLAFPRGAEAEVRRLVAQMGHVVKEVSPHGA